MYINADEEAGIELKNCPCCGCKAYLYKDTYVYKVECSVCGVQTLGCSSAQIVVEMWNRRDGEKKRERKVKKC